MVRPSEASGGKFGDENASKLPESAFRHRFARNSLSSKKIHTWHPRRSLVSKEYGKHGDAWYLRLRRGGISGGAKRWRFAVVSLWGFVSEAARGIFVSLLGGSVVAPHVFGQRKIPRAVSTQLWLGPYRTSRIHVQDGSW
eukprot:3715451-Rhodomonas_salina.1